MYVHTYVLTYILYLRFNTKTRRNVLNQGKGGEGDDNLWEGWGRRGGVVCLIHTVAQTAATQPVNRYGTHSTGRGGMGSNYTQNLDKIILFYNN